MFHAYFGEHKALPHQMSDLEPYRDRFPSALEAIESQEWIVILEYGRPDVETFNSEQILAFEKCLPKKGGFVVRHDGSTAYMDPEEFRLARESPAKTRSIEVGGPR
jgi:hypothetical protein